MKKDFQQRSNDFIKKVLSVEASEFGPGWTQIDAGYTRRKDLNGQAKIFVRKRLLAEILTKNSEDELRDKAKMSLNEGSENAEIPKVTGQGTNPGMGFPYPELSPIPISDSSSFFTADSEFRSGTTLVRSFDVLSLRSLSYDSNSLVIGFDSEWFSENKNRFILSWQFSVAFGLYLYEFVFLRLSADDFRQSGGAKTALL